MHALAGSLGADGEFARDGAAVLQLNQKDGWKWRELWNSVLPIFDAENLVNRPWVSLDEPNIDLGPAPSIMLRPELGVVPFLLKKEKLDALIGWVRGQDPFGIAYVGADGGMGKTRLAIELCKKLHDHGWLTGWLPETDRGISAARVPRFVVVDYVEERGHRELLEKLDMLARSASKMSPVRVLLLNRPTASGSVAKLISELRISNKSGGLLELALTHARDMSDAATELSAAESEVLFRSALIAFGEAWGGKEWMPGEFLVLTPQKSHGRPLDVLLEALDVALLPQRADAVGAPLDRVLEHEQRHWTTKIREVNTSILRLAVTLATLAGARTRSETAELLGLITESGADTKHLDALDGWLRNLYRGDMLWNPLRPDRLGEALVKQSILDDHGGEELVVRVLTLSSDLQVEQALDVLVRLVDDPGLKELIGSAFTRCYSMLVERAERQSLVPQQNGLGLLQGVFRMHVAVFGDATNGF